MWVTLTQKADRNQLFRYREKIYLSTVCMWSTPSDTSAGKKRAQHWNALHMSFHRSNPQRCRLVPMFAAWELLLSDTPEQWFFFYRLFGWSLRVHASLGTNMWKVDSIGRAYGASDSPSDKRDWEEKTRSSFEAGGTVLWSIPTVHIFHISPTVSRDEKKATLPSGYLPSSAASPQVTEDQLALLLIISFWLHFGC